MRDDRLKWPAPSSAPINVTLDDAVLSSVAEMRQTLISGPNVLRQLDVPVGAWPNPVIGESYALSLRRDRILQINGPKVALGWDDAKSLAVSDASDAYAVFELLGQGAFDVLKRGTEISLAVPSKSVTRRLFGLAVMVYRHEAEDRFRLHVARASADALVAQISAAAGHR